MNHFGVAADVEIIQELLGLSVAELAQQLGVTHQTIYNWKANEEQITAKNFEKIYNFAYSKSIRLNKIKEQFCREECPAGHKVLFHGSKTYIDGALSVEKAKEGNDFGRGFYCGESLEQSAMFVANFPSSSLYIVDFDPAGLKYVQLGVNRDWMLLIAYFRKKLDAYGDHPILQELLARLEGVDYIIAPIADNRMFEIIDSFIDGEITDVQCQHCLSATNLGNQYVFVTAKALKQVTLLHRCYLAQAEKKAYLLSRMEEQKISNDKVKLARKQYRGQGDYIEDILR
ncbi:MAG: DUF3990 domain-containing protein [Faecousia sp.]